ncbi:MAG: ATP F0F1 synthase subunit B [Hyphomicrobiales bacterium]|nr:ATP F0F1 synthase subunit B [Hyphomicrobiales bacterium]
MHFDASFFVAIGFILFVLLLGYLGVHTLIGKTLDDRGAAVAAELNEAKRLREEAEALLTSYKAKAAEAEKEAADIVASAKEEAEAMAQEAAKRSEEFVARRTRQAEEKIARAEAQAASEVRTAAANAAVAAAEAVMRGQVKGDAGADLVMKGIGDLKAKLH